LLFASKGFAMTHAPTPDAAGAAAPSQPAEFAELATLAAAINQQFARRTFGAIWFWRSAVVRPHDEGQFLLTCEVLGEGEDAHLALQLQHASGQGHPAVLSVWQAQGLSLDAQALRLQHASRLHFGPAQACLEGDYYRLQTPAGESRFALEGAAALNLQI